MVNIGKAVVADQAYVWCRADFNEAALTRQALTSRVARALPEAASIFTNRHVGVAHPAVQRNLLSSPLSAASTPAKHMRAACDACE